jgi:replication-associated recombination protein RarA
MFYFAPDTQDSLLLTDIYKPKTTAEFVGLEKPKRLAIALAKKPFSSYYIFRGPSGIGKTTFAFAMAEEIGADVHHIPSKYCTEAELERHYSACFYMPSQGKRCHMIIIDEADLMTKASRDCLLSMMDGTRPAPNTIIVMTSNDVEKFEDRFISRCQSYNFSSQATQKDSAALLARVWKAEAPEGADAPNFARIVKDANSNIRMALNALQQELTLVSV